MFNTPILFIVFNRPELTAKSLAAIRKVQPARLYVAADGPRDGEGTDATKCREVRSLITEGINWPCTVQYLYRQRNLGCGKAVSGAIDWFFEQEEAGIILEDDCLPAPDFFVYSAKMLDIYRDADKIMHISGSYLISSIRNNQPEPYFSIYPHIWGWATWRRAWNKYGFTVTSDALQAVQLKLGTLGLNAAEQFYWLGMFLDMSQKLIDTWDYQWQLAIWLNNGTTINPGSNLVRNIGFGPEATHTKYPDSFFVDQQVSEGDASDYQMTGSLRHRPDLDRLVSRHVYRINSTGEKQAIWFRRLLRFPLRLVRRVIVPAR